MEHVLNPRLVGIGGPVEGGIYALGDGEVTIGRATDNGMRAPLSDGQMQNMLPDRGPFSFGAPYGTQGIRITNAGDCGGG